MNDDNIQTLLLFGILIMGVCIAYGLVVISQLLDQLVQRGITVTHIEDEEDEPWRK